MFQRAVTKKNEELWLRQREVPRVFGRREIAEARFEHWSARKDAVAEQESQRS